MHWRKTDGQRARKDDAVLQRIAGARGRLRAVAENFELPVLVAHQVGGVQDAASGPAAAGSRGTARRKPGLAHSNSGGSTPLKTVSAGPYRSASKRSSSRARWISPSLTLSHCAAGDQQGDEVQAPGPVQAVRVAVDVVRDAVLVNQPPRLFAPVAELSGLQFIEQRNKFPPVRPEGPSGSTISSGNGESIP